MEENHKNIIRKAFEVIFEKKHHDEETIGLYFSRNYRQWVDGHELDFQDFIAHIKAQGKRIERLSVTFKSMVAEGNRVATIHLIDALTKEGFPVKGKVMAQFTLEDNRIVACEELTYFSEAREKDRDLGSVR
ncbi:nuclear transport factor 2 family protein [Legionella spiritensis]|uniref:nuclear transport factor 2 family protein n=1 Tax=Legionella spiritensis TaxID=452 RepID=UPI000F6E1A25|nr:nuclear transport factor 2 family protein [Legionella spiritensis]VEG90230.1 Uncharacterised protein [Legionella spiritensis]